MRPKAITSEVPDNWRAAMDRALTVFKGEAACAKGAILGAAGGAVAGAVGGALATGGTAALPAAVGGVVVGAASGCVTGVRAKVLG
jgi:hypothetical protein